MKKIFFSIFLLGILAILTFAGAGCRTAGEKEIAAARQVVENYLKHTLGMIPGARIDYDEAKRDMVDEFAAQFYGPGFVPESYCIQDGPTEVAITSTKVSAAQAAIKVNAKFGDKWREKEKWEFILIKDNNGWRISDIKCL